MDSEGKQHELLMLTGL